MADRMIGIKTSEVGHGELAHRMFFVYDFASAPIEDALGNGVHDQFIADAQAALGSLLSPSLQTALEAALPIGAAGFEVVTMVQTLGETPLQFKNRAELAFEQYKTQFETKQRKHYAYSGQEFTVA